MGEVRTDGKCVEALVYVLTNLRNAIAKSSKLRAAEQTAEALTYVFMGDWRKTVTNESGSSNA